MRRSRRTPRCLNAPYGARCFLTGLGGQCDNPSYPRLNAPYGARCFLTSAGRHAFTPITTQGLNAPYGARCFLTHTVEFKDIATMS